MGPVSVCLSLFLPVLTEEPAVASASTEDEVEEGDGNCTVACNEDKQRGSKKQRYESIPDSYEKNKEHYTFPYRDYTLQVTSHPSIHSPPVVLRWFASKEAPQVVVFCNSTCSWLPAYTCTVSWEE